MNGRQAITSSFGANRQQLGGIHIEQYGICMHRPDAQEDTRAQQSPRCEQVSKTLAALPLMRLGCATVVTPRLNFHGDVMHFYDDERTQRMFAYLSFIDAGYASRPPRTTRPARRRRVPHGSGGFALDR